MDKDKFKLSETIEGSMKCFICFAKVVSNKIDTDLSSLRNVETDVKLYPFKNILQYLNLNLGEILKISITEGEEIQGSVCNDCAIIMNNFSKHFLELEVIQMKIRFCLENILQNMMDADAAISMNQEQNNRKNDNFIIFKTSKFDKNNMLRVTQNTDELRQETIESISQMFAKLQPIILMKNLTFDEIEIKQKELKSKQGSNFVPESETSSKVIKQDIYDDDDSITDHFAKNFDIAVENQSNKSSNQQNQNQPKSELYCCPICNLKTRIYHHVFSTHSEAFPLKIKDEKSGNIRFHCKSCKMSFGFLKHYQRHYLTFHTSFCYSCKLCDFKHKYRAVLTKHMKTDHGINQKRKQGGLKLKLKPEIEKNIEKNPQSGKYNCKICQGEFNTKSYCVEHYQSKHAGVRYQCKRCNLRFLYRKHYNRHFQTKHLQQRSRCGKCGKFFSQKDAVQLHLRNGSCKGRIKIKIKIPQNKPNVEGNENEQLSNEETEPNVVKSEAKYGDLKNVEPPIIIINGMEVEENLTENENELELNESQTKFQNQNKSGTSESSPITNTDQLPTNKSSIAKKSGKKSKSRSKMNPKKPEILEPEPILNVETPNSFTDHCIQNLDTETVTCKVCSKDYKSYGAFHTHFKASHLRIKYPCSLCPKQFSTSGNLSTHQRCAHNVVQLECSKCWHSFDTNFDFIEHCKNSTNCGYVEGKVKGAKCNFDPESGKYKCQVCLKEMDSLKSFPRHYSKTHPKVRFRCKVCNREFARLEFFKSHHHDDEKNKRSTFKCFKCERNFKTRSHLSHHLNSKCGKRENNSTIFKNGSLTCDQCGKVFGLLQNLQKHVKAVHLKLRNHLCDLCGMKFSHKQSLQIHQKRKHFRNKNGKNKEEKKDINDDC